MKKLIVCILSVGLSLLALDAMAAASVKTGVIDVNQILQQSNEVKAMMDKLRKQFKPREDAIVAAQKEMQADREKLGRDRSVMKEADVTKLEDKIIAERSKLQSLQESFQQDLATTRNRDMKRILKNMKEKVREYAKKNGYQVLLLAEGVAYSDTSIDVTNDILKEVNK